MESDDMAEAFEISIADGFDVGFDVGVMKLTELRYLAKSLSKDEPKKESAEIADTSKNQPPSMNNEQSYGNPLSPAEAVQAVPSGSDGLIRFATVVPDKFCVNGTLVVEGLNSRDFDAEKGIIKPRRPSLPITQTDLMSSLTVVDGEEGPRYIFNGILNGWPSLRNFELVGLAKKRRMSLPGGVKTPDYMINAINMVGKGWVTYWRADDQGKKGIPPVLTEGGKVCRATLRGAPWSSLGWSPTSPGFLFWFETQRPEGPRLVYGSDIIEAKLKDDDVCKVVHMISHRYSTGKETAKDKLTYHSIVFLEWENSDYGTIVEGAFLNGIGGYKGKSNWYDDKDDEVTELYKALPPEMISPWLTTGSELRCYDVKAKNLDELKKYIAKHTGPNKRFLDPQYTFSNAARLTFRSRSNIAHYLLNYISRNCSYSEMTRNCQTLAADLCCFLAGKKDVVPYHPLNRLEYHNKTHLFLYDSTMYKPKRGEHLKGRVAR